MEFLRALDSLRADVLITAILCAAAISAGIAVHPVLYWLVRRQAKRGSSVLAAVVNRTERPAAYIIPVAFIASTLIALVRLWADISTARCLVDVDDNLLGRQSQTRVGILAQTTIILIILVGIAIALMTFAGVRAVGATLLASAGAAGLLIGLAARPLFENLVAGIQLALTEPIRLDDVLVVQPYWGRVEEITTTYVVVRISDLRPARGPAVVFHQQPVRKMDPPHGKSDRRGVCSRRLDGRRCSPALKFRRFSAARSFGTV